MLHCVDIDDLGLTIAFWCSWAVRDQMARAHYNHRRAMLARSVTTIPKGNIPDGWQGG